MSIPASSHSSTVRRQFCRTWLTYALLGTIVGIIICCIELDILLLMKDSSKVSIHDFLFIILPSLLVISFFFAAIMGPVWGFPFMMLAGLAIAIIEAGKGRLSFVSAACIALAVYLLILAGFYLCGYNFHWVEAAMQPHGAIRVPFAIPFILIVSPALGILPVLGGTAVCWRRLQRTRWNEVHSSADEVNPPA